MVGAGLPIFRPSIGTQDGITPSVWVVYQLNSNSQYYARLYSLTVAGGVITTTALIPAIALGTASSTVTAVACGADNICYIATTAPFDTTIRLYRVDPKALTATIVWSKVWDYNVNNITQIWPYSSPLVYFNLLWDRDGTTPWIDNRFGLYKSSDNGLTYNYMNKGYNDTQHAGVCDFAIARGKRIYTSHSVLVTAGLNSIISYTDNDGATWTDIPNTAAEVASTSAWNTISLSPLDSDTTRIWYSSSHGNLGIQTSYMDSSLNVTLNPLFLGVQDNQWIDGHYYTTNNRFVWHDRFSTNVTSYKSTDGGATWDTPGTLNTPDTGILGRTLMWSILPLQDWILVATPLVNTLHVSLSPGVWIDQDLGLGGVLIKGCAWINGRT